MQFSAACPYVSATFAVFTQFLCSGPLVSGLEGGHSAALHPY